MISQCDDISFNHPNFTYLLNAEIIFHELKKVHLLTEVATTDWMRRGEKGTMPTGICLIII